MRYVVLFTVADIVPQPPSGGAVLVVTSGVEVDVTTLLKELVAAVDERPNILVVTLSESPEAWLERWHDHLPRPPANIGFVTLNEYSRSAIADASGRPRPGDEISTQTVATPADLTGLGMATTSYLTDWEDTDRPTVVYFDSVTILLQYVELEPGFRFLHTLTSQLKDADATGIFPFTTAAHDDRTVKTLQSLFDTILIPNAEGTHLVCLTDE